VYYTKNMLENQFFSFIKKPIFILALILVVFFLKGVFLTALFPIFTGQDEARHYNSIQYINEPENKTWETTKRTHIEKKETFNDYNFSEEIIKTGRVADFDVFRHELFNTVNFSDSYDGKNEADINSKPWRPYNFYDPPDTAGNSLYHVLGVQIEKIFSRSDIFVRFFSIRIFSVLLGTLAILLAYLIAKNIGLKEKYSLILTAIIAFQPKYAMYSAIINYDVLLIPLFFLFTLGAVLSLKNGLNWKNFLIMVVAVFAGLFTKGTAIVMLGMFIFLIACHIYKKIKEQKKKISVKFILLPIISILVIMFFSSYNFLELIPYKKSLSETLVSLGQYLSESLTLGRFGLSSRTYWGSLGWFDNLVENNFTDIVWLIEIIAGAGIIYFLFSKKKFTFLPEKKYVIFLLAMIVSLQLGVRIADWKIFMRTGGLDLGTPGRYFLPNLASHIILLFVGLGALLRKERYFKNALILGLILTFSFSMYLTFNVILPRYYL